MRYFIRKRLLPVLLLVCVLPLAGCGDERQADQPPPQLYLYGEQHGQDIIMEKELELWQNYYDEENMRHLFLELPGYTAEYLNLWMQAEDDTILEQIYEDWRGTAIYDGPIRDFYRRIKTNCPETVFHGVDLGHQRATTGRRYLEYCEANGLTDSAAYKRAQLCVEQGRRYYDNEQDQAYREDIMTQYFSQEFAALENESVMGIFGSDHVAMETSGTMAANLRELYGESLHCKSLTYLLLATEPLRYDSLNINGKEYQAAYYGDQDLSGFLPDYVCREFWRIEQAYEDFKNQPTSGDVLPYDNYPMQIETGQVFLVVYTKSDGGTVEQYFRADGNSWRGRPTTEEFSI